MRMRFFLMTALMCLLLSAWIWLEHQYEAARREKLRQLSELPVYVYVADSTNVAPLLERLSEFSQLRNVNLETGLQAADELVKAYQLPIALESIKEYRFPSIITLLFKPHPASIEQKPLVIKAITEQHVDLADIDAQSIAWAQVSSEINTLNRRWLSYTIISSIMLALLFFYIRLSYELRFLLMQKKKLISVADGLRISSQNNQHTWTMLVLPLLISVGGYFLLQALGYSAAIIPLWWFAIPAGTLLVATVSIFITLNMYFHDKTFMPELDSPDAANENNQ